MFRLIEVHLVYVGCNLHVINSSSVSKKGSVVRSQASPGAVRRMQKLVTSVNSPSQGKLPTSSRTKRLSLLLCVLVTKRVKMAGHGPSSFLVLFLLTEKKFALFASGPKCCNCLAGA